MKVINNTIAKTINNISTIILTFLDIEVFI